MTKLSWLFAFFLFLHSPVSVGMSFCFSGNYESGSDEVHVQIASDGVLESGYYYVKAEFSVTGKPEKTIKTTFFCKATTSTLYFGKSSDEIRMDSPDATFNPSGSLMWTNPRFLFYSPNSSWGVLLTSCMEILSDIPPEYSAPPEEILEVTLDEGPVYEEGEMSGDDIWDFAQESPVYPGGDAALGVFIQEHMDYPKVAAESGIQGTVYLEFVVEKDGTLSNIRVVRSVNALLDQEAMRLVRLMPNWEPGKVNGKAVRSKYYLPVKFVLE